MYLLSKSWNEANQLHYFSNEIVEDPGSIANETSCPGKLFAKNYQKNSLVPSAVKFAERNTKAAIFLNESF